MANEYALFAQMELLAEDNDVYEIPVDTQFIGTVNIVNTSAAAVTVKLALAATDTPTAAEWIDMIELQPNGGGVERSGLTLQAGKHIVVQADDVGVTAAVWGMQITTGAP